MWRWWSGGAAQRPLIRHPGGRGKWGTTLLDIYTTGILVLSVADAMDYRGSVDHAATADAASDDDVLSC